MSVLDAGRGYGRGRALGLRWAGLDRWNLGALAIALVVAAPVASVVVLALRPAENIWPHLAATVLPAYLENTFWLMLGVGSACAVGGVGTAWLVALCRFPGRRVFEWALLLPLAVPAYVVAYVYTDLLDFAGPVQVGLRTLMGWGSAREYFFPEVRSLGGAIVMLSLVLYPYVYLMARAAFQEQSVCVIEVSRTLGRGPWRSFFTVALPLARPAIVAGLVLVLLETLNDFGTVDFFAVNTFSRGIFNVWLGMNNVSGAAQIASVLLLVVIVLIGLERLSRRRRRYHHTSSKYRPLPRYHLRGATSAAAFVFCAAPVLLGFAVPAAVLLKHAAGHYVETLDDAFFAFVANSLALSGLAAAVAVGLSLFLAYALRIGGGPALRGAVRLASLGYAVPGAVLAVGVMVPFGWLDNAVDGWARDNLGVSTGLVLSGTMFAVLFAYVVRFLAVAFGAVESSLVKVTPHMDQAARSLGAGPAETLRRVHLPLIRGSMLTAALLVFVDAMKELPMTLMLRPFGFQSLATYVYQYAGDEQIERAALAALAIVGAGILPVLALNMAIARARPGQGASAT